MTANISSLVSKTYLFPIQERPYLLFRKDVLPPFPLKVHRIPIACAVFPHTIHIIPHCSLLLFILHVIGIHVKLQQSHYHYNSFQTASRICSSWANRKTGAVLSIAVFRLNTVT